MILPHGVLFRGNAEAAIRRQLLTRGFIKGIIGLPPNLFYGTGIPACIVVLDKENAHARKGVFMIDASRGFIKDGAKNRLRSQDIHKIVDVFNRQSEIEHYSRMVPLAEIAGEANDYNLNIPRYIDSSEPEDIQDLHAHLHGGIPDRDIDMLGIYWEAFPSLHAMLFEPNRPGYSDLAIDVSAVRQAVLDSAEFQQFSTEVAEQVGGWFSDHRVALASIDKGTKPDELIATLGDDLLARFRDISLLDEYDIYEQLLSYWHEAMHDDVFMVMREGWLKAVEPRAARVIGYDKNKKPKFEDCHIKFGTGMAAERYVMDLVPPDLVVAHYFVDEQTALDEINAIAEQAASALQEYVEEHAIEGGLLWEAVDDKGKVTQKSVGARLREAKTEHDDEVIAALTSALGLITSEATAQKAAKNAQGTLDLATLEQYGVLSEDHVKVLVLDNKWRATVLDRVEGVLTSLVLALVSRLQALGERYGETLGSLEAKLAELSDRVAAHLDEMGVT